jgi:F0F1-type ATP synthase epsilon subunit
VSPRTLHLQVLSPTGVIFSGDVASIIIPAYEGLMGILPGHIPLVAMLQPGFVTAHPAPHSSSASPQSTIANRQSQMTTPPGTLEPLSFPVSGGFARIGPDAVTVLATLPAE